MVNGKKTQDLKVILITGGSGTLGRAIVQKFLKENHDLTYQLRIISRGEQNQYQMATSLGISNHPNIRFIIGDVRDYPRLITAMTDVYAVIHAAALKHVPICEYNPIEATETNVNGSKNVIRAAIACGVDRVLGVSTDKACLPINYYGASKMIMEKLFIQANSYSPDGTRFSCTRYGNVFGSSGSVIQLWKQQALTGEITITDPRMTRFWITQSKAADFVWNAVTGMNRGCIYVPKMPAVNLGYLAENIFPDVEIKNIGIRPGEKIHETLITRNEAPRTHNMGGYYCIYPEFPFWTEDESRFGKKVKTGFEYTSKNITTNELKLNEIISEAIK